MIEIQGFTRDQAYIFASKIIWDKSQIDAILRFDSNLKLEFTDEPVSDDDNEEVENNRHNNDSNDDFVQGDDSNGEFVNDDGNNEEFINAYGDYDEADHHSHLYKNPICFHFSVFLLNINKLILARLWALAKYTTGWSGTCSWNMLGDKTYSSDHFVQVVKAIGKLALETLLSGKSLFRKSQVVEALGPNAFDFCILIGHEDAHSLIPYETADIFVTFAHRSIQEFLGVFFFISSINEGLSIAGLLGNPCGKPMFLTNPLFFSFLCLADL